MDLEKPETLLESDINFYRLQLYYKKTQWYSTFPSNYYKIPGVKVSKSLKPDKSQIFERWKVIHPEFKGKKIPTQKKMLAEIATTETIELVNAQKIKTVKIGEMDTKLTNMFYYDRELAYYLVKYAHLLSLDNLDITELDNETQLHLSILEENGDIEYSEPNLRCNYQLEITLSFQLANINWLISTNMSNLITMLEDSFYLNINLFSDYLRRLFVSGIAINPVIQNYWLDYWKVSELRDEWLKKIQDKLKLFGSQYGIGKLIPANVKYWLDNFFSNNYILPEYNEEIITTIFENGYQNTQPSNLVNIPNYLSTSSLTKEWCKPSKKVEPDCVVNSSECRMLPSFGFVPSSQYSKYGNDACQKRGAQTYLYRGTQYYIPRFIPSLEKKYPELRGILNYQGVKSVLTFPETNWKQEQCLGSDCQSYHPLQLSLSNRDLDFRFKRNELENIRMYVIDYETSGSLLAKNKTEREIQLFGDHYFRVNQRQGQDIKCISVANCQLRQFEYSINNNLNQIYQFNGRKISYNGILKAQITNSVTIDTPKYRYQLEQRTIQKINKKTGEDIQIGEYISDKLVRWEIEGVSVVTRLVNEGSEMKLIHVMGDETTLVPTSKTGPLYYFNGGKFEYQVYPNRGNFLREWFSSFCFYYHLFLYPFWVKPFREGRSHYENVPTQLGIIDVSPGEKPISETLEPWATYRRNGLCGSFHSEPNKNHRNRAIYKTFLPTTSEQNDWMSIRYLDNLGRLQDIQVYQGCDAVRVSGLDDSRMEGAEPFRESDMVELDHFLRNGEGKEPVIVLIAHNGYGTDFPLLVEQYLKFNKAIPKNIVWIDTQVVISNFMSIIAPYYNYPNVFREKLFNPIDYLVARLIEQKKRLTPGYYLPLEIDDILSNRQIHGVKEGTECEYQVLETKTGKRSMREGELFCFFQDNILENEHDAYCDVLGLWQVVLEFFRTIYQGSGVYHLGGPVDESREREFIVTRLLVNELLV